METESQARIFKLVKDHFGLRSESLKYFEKELYEPKIDETYEGILGESKDLRRYWTLPEEMLGKIDNGWKDFRVHFKSFVYEYKVKYSDFRQNRIKIEKNEVKLRKALIKFYEEKRHLAENDRISTWNVPIAGKIDGILNAVGTQKLPKNPLKIVLSLNFIDWFLCSTSENWKSCLSLGYNEYSFWAGLPGLIGDKNRAMIYLTDEQEKKFYSITANKVLSRSWALLDQDDRLNIINWCPQVFLNTDQVSDITKINFRHFGSDFFSKKPIRHLFFTNGCSCFIYQDGTHFTNAKHLEGGGGGFQFIDNKDTICDDDLFKCNIGLIGLLENGKKITHYDREDMGYCSCCDDEYFHNEFRYFRGDAYCDHCYDKYIGSCEHCHEDTHTSELLYIYSTEEYVCHRCLGDNYFRCYKCGEYHLKINRIKKKGRWYCSGCIEDNYCEDCQTVYDDLVYLYITNTYICKECLEEEVSKYQFKLLSEEVA